MNINPILHGGPNRPPLADDLSWFLRGCSKWAQISWVCFYQHLPRPIEAIFQKKILKFWKTEIFFFDRSDIKGSPLWNFFFSKLFFSIFLVTNHTFSTWICILHVLSFLLRYITWVLVKIFKFSFFTIEFLSITKFFPQPLMAKIIIKKDCFWYVWTGKDQNFVLRIIFCHLHANWRP